MKLPVPTSATLTIGTSPIPSNGYVAEDNTTAYVAEDGVTFYVQSSTPTPVPTPTPTPAPTPTPGPSPATTIGGIAVGSPGTGIYSGYILAGGDDFDGPLNIVNVNNPNGWYWPTWAVATGARSGLDTGAGASGYYRGDPYSTGSQDSNRGVPVPGFSDLLVQSGSKIAHKSRIADSSELPYIAGTSFVGAAFMSLGYFTCSPPCILEHNTSYSTNSAPGGYHATGWWLSAGGTGHAPSLEIDWPESAGNVGGVANSSKSYGNVNILGAPSGSGWNTVQGLQQVGAMGSGQQTFNALMTTSALSYVYNGTSTLQTFSHDATTFGRPLYWLFSGGPGQTGGYHGSVRDQAAWTALGSTGVTMSCDWWRVWIPAGGTVISPQIPMGQGVGYAYGSPISYAFPSFSSLWAGAATSDYCEIRKFEDFEPGCNQEDQQAKASTRYVQFPFGLTWDNTNRVLSGTLTQPNPGRMHLLCTPYKQGCAGYVWRDWIDIGPRIDLTDFVVVNTPSTTIDLYYVCNCGSLVPKTITVTGLPSGVTYDSTTNLLTVGTASNGTTAITVTVTNAVGQTATKTVNMILQASADAMTLDGSSVSGTISTTKPRDILVAMFYQSGGDTMIGVTSTSGLTWIRRGLYQTTIANEGVTVDVWYARSNGILTNEVITPNAVPQAQVVFAVNGADMVTPFDVDSSLIIGGILQAGASVGPTSTALTTGAISTTAANSLAFTILQPYTGTSLGTITTPSGFTKIGSINNAAYQVNLSTVSGESAAWSWTAALPSFTSSSGIIDALQGQR